MKDSVIETTDHYIICRTANDFKLIDKYFEKLGYSRKYNFDFLYEYLNIKPDMHTLFSYDDIINETNAFNASNIGFDGNLFKYSSDCLEAKTFLRKLKLERINE